MPIVHEDGVYAPNPDEGARLVEQGYQKCRNQLCDFYVSPDTLEYEYNHGGDNATYQCPHCGLTYPLFLKPGRPGGGTASGLDLDVMGQIGENIIEDMGVIPGFGAISWWHKGGAATNSALDGATNEWGIEVKTVNWNTQRPRGIIKPKDAVDKANAINNPRVFADKVQDPALEKAIVHFNWKGFLGVMVYLDFYDSTADIYVKPIEAEVPGKMRREEIGHLYYKSKGVTQIAEKVPFDNPLPDPRQPDFVPFHQQPPVNNDWTFSRTAMDYAGDGLPAEEPQAVEDRNNSIDTPIGPREYDFSFANGKLSVGSEHEEAEPGRPHAYGKVVLVDDRATWEVNGNIGGKALERVFKDYCNRVGWEWGGLADHEGEPLGTGSEFAPVKSVWYRLAANDQLELSHKWLGDGRRIFILGKNAYYPNSASPTALAGLQEWAQDFGYKLAEYPGGSNMNDMIRNDNPLGEDLELKNLGDPSPTILEPAHEDPNGLIRCTICDRLIPGWRAYNMHRKDHEGPEDDRIEDGHFPELGEGVESDQPQFFEARTAAKQPKDMFNKPIPFIYDIEQDDVFVGHPGARHADIEGKFTPGGIVEGTYEPGGKVFLRSMTNMPYTVRHLVQLWYYQHPEFEVTGVTLRDSAGNETKLAAESNAGIAAYVVAQAAANPAVHNAWQALTRAGGNVYAVGGAVRDALLNKRPKDIDLLVQGVPADDVHKALKSLPGRVDLTGKDFGVFRYREGADEVEIALPRQERSTGDRRVDFDVQVDHNLPVHDDLLRRDFTANAIAVNLNTGKIVDPYGGQTDIAARTLKTVHPSSFEEDPTRLVRALVAHARHGLTPDESTQREIEDNAHRLGNESAERIQAELDKLFSSDDPAKAIELAHRTGMLKHLLPEVDAAFNFDQRNPHHAHDLGTHLLNVLRNASEISSDPDVRLAALLHDIGKPASQWVDDKGIGHYYESAEHGGQDHETVGARMAVDRLRALKYPNDRIHRIRDLIQHHMYPDFSSPKGARKFLNNVGDHADDLFVLRRADREGKGTDSYQAKKTPVEHQRGLVDQVRAAGEPTDLSNLAINGNDLIGLGMTPGPQFASILEQLTQLVIENPELNDRHTLLGIVRDEFGTPSS